MMFGGWKSNRLETRRDKDTPNRIYVTGPSEPVSRPQTEIYIDVHMFTRLHAFHEFEGGAQSLH